MTSRCYLLAGLFILTFISPLVEYSSADDTLSDAIELNDGDSQNGYLCYPDCSNGYGPEDRFDYYKVYLDIGEMLHVKLYNEGNPAQVWLDMTIIDYSSSALTSTARIGHLDYGILTHIATYAGYHYIRLEAIAGNFDDDSFYILNIDIESNNLLSGADTISLGEQLTDYVCASYCDDPYYTPDLFEDNIDWYEVNLPSLTGWGLSIEKENQNAYIDFDIFEMDSSGVLQSVVVTQEGGGSYQYSTAWGNTTVPTTYFIRVQAYSMSGYYGGTEYFLSISAGEWYTVKEDSSSDPTAGFSYITINDVRAGETIRAHAIRTYAPNDLDVLLYNESEFEVYKEYIRNNSDGTREIPSELMKKEDCWVCSVELQLSESDVGLTLINPGRSANRSTDLSWTPTFYLVADYTDYLQDPPWNGVQDISHVFLSLDVDRGMRSDQYYTVEKYNSSSSIWQFVQSGVTASGSLSAPASGWDANENFTNHISYTDYRVTVTDSSMGGNIVSQSQFRSINMAPIPCFDAKGVENSIATIHVPVTFDATCSSDPDSLYSNQDIVAKTWYIDGNIHNSNTVTGVFTETDVVTVSLKVEDDQGLVRWKNQTISIVEFPTSSFVSSIDIHGQTTIRIDTNYTVNETITWRPSWADVEIANKVIGVGLAFNFQRTHIGYLDVDIDPNTNGQFTSLDAQVIASSDRYILKLKPQVQFYWYDVDDLTDGDNFSFAVPSLVERYTNQQNFTDPYTNQQIYLWNEYDEVFNGTALTNQYGQSQSVFENITISAIDLYPFIVELANYNSVTGSVAGFINSFADIEILLEFGIMLELTMDNTLLMHATTTNDFYDYNNSSSLVNFASFQTSAYDYYTDSNTFGQVLNTTNISGTKAFSLYPFYQWTSDTEIYGFVNLTINIAPQAWLSSILSWFMENPDSLSQSWSYRLFESPTPIAASGNSGYVPLTTRYDIFAPNHDGDSYWDGVDDDDDNDGILDVDDDCSKGELSWTSYQSTDYDQDGCRDVTEDLDDDNDGMPDVSDYCSTGLQGWESTPQNDYDSDGCQDLNEDSDDDNDGVTDTSDLCSVGLLGWISTSFTDHDSDGCSDSLEDNDDDNDLVMDNVDQCPVGLIGWSSSSSNDYDGDGCLDSAEDNDDDDDGVMDLYDQCVTGLKNWASSQSTDYDNDGCNDTTEDSDDDNDGIIDTLDTCSKGSLNWLSSSTLDYDSDGCRDSSEDDDDDNDLIKDEDDNCRIGDLGWNSNSNTDYDTDGCRDSTEDTDDDNDNIADLEDGCQRGEIGWSSTGMNDYDSDGCNDSTEDDDDDSDDIPDHIDDCERGDLGWISTLDTDYDMDGCNDNTEDLDDDNDEVLDSVDLCQTGTLGWSSTDTNDYDSDGCNDLTEDNDTDNDLVLDLIDQCLNSELGWESSNSTDNDNDGCNDDLEDSDDDNDGYGDQLDACPRGLLNWESENNDHDSDGCHDELEDSDDDNDGVNDEYDQCALGMTGWQSYTDSDYDSDGCNDRMEDSDDDNDAIEDNSDLCPSGKLEWSSTASSDYDGDGCQDSTEDNDDDNDNVSDEDDAFPLDARYKKDSDSDGVADIIDVFPQNPDQKSDTDGDGFGDNTGGLNGDSCPDDPYPDTPNGCQWTVLGWVKAHPVLTIASPISAIIVVTLIIIYLRRNSEEENEGSEQILPKKDNFTGEEPHKELPPITTDDNGYEWTQFNGNKYYRPVNSDTDWQKYEL